MSTFSSYEVDFTDGRDLVRRLGDRAKAHRAFGIALNRVLRDTRSGTKKEIRQKLNVKARSIDSRMSVRKPRGKLEGSVVFREKNPPQAMSFTYSRATKRKGLAVRFRKDKPQQYVARGFVRTVHGEKLALQRKVIGGKRVGRKPLAGIYGPSPVGLMQNEGFGRDQQSKMADRLVREVDRVIQNVVLKGR